MPDFHDIQSLNKYIENKYLKSMLEKIGTEVKDVLRHYILFDWYSEHTPKIYQRTMDVLNSVTVSGAKRSIDGGWQVKIYFDDSKIRQQVSTWDLPKGYTRFNYHMSVRGEDSYNGMSIGQWVVYWMNYGQDSPIYSFKKGAGFWESTLEFIRDDNYHVTRMKELLGLKGIYVE